MSMDELPHNCEAIMEHADPPGLGTSMEKLLDRLRCGVFLDENRQKYWIDGKTGYNCFMVFARDLSITWGNDNRYWNWASFQETSNVFVDIASLTNVCWLEVRGKLDTSNLSPGVKYVVTFVISLKNTANGWNVPVNFELILPDGTKQERKEDFPSKPKGQLLEILVGEFETGREMEGDVKFSLIEINGGLWKSGLVLKGVRIQPKK
ncbi:hypothetical protein NE237_020084 [Protea cynaroides]|uniref:Uncharacterized protein n=1 Tax=Protea cynaroides TaxID=273540 RepID=A0A9Q0HAG2_9MAGN|nr:hypothetical protein NE237_020084 [Protea cynaroides]